MRKDEKNEKIEFILFYLFIFIDCKKNILNLVKFLIKWIRILKKILKFISQIKNNYYLFFKR